MPWICGKRDVSIVRVSYSLETPIHRLEFDVRHGMWWLDWGTRPKTADQACAVMREYLLTMPRLIPFCMHRCIPSQPGLSGNPVFSTYGFDTIVYGHDLADYIAKEFSQPRPEWAASKFRTIAFWTELSNISSETWERIQLGSFES